MRSVRDAAFELRTVRPRGFNRFAALASPSYFYVNSRHPRLSFFVLLPPGGADSTAVLTLGADYIQTAEGVLDVAEAGPVHLAVYDMLGREVAQLVDEVLAAGRHEALFDGSGLMSSAYLVRMAAGSNNVQTRTVLHVRLHPIR